MFLTAVLIISFFFLLVLLIYAIYKLCWYIVKLLALKKTIKELVSNGRTVTYRRHFSDVVFGNKGLVDFVLTTPEETLEVSILSLISTHSRWNIEKTRENYYLEARRYNKLIYKKEFHAEHPEHAMDYKRETRMQRCKLILQPREGVRQVLMIYPRPALLTYTHKQYEYLDTGSKIDGYEVMYAEDFFALFLDEQGE